VPVRDYCWIAPRAAVDDVAIHAFCHWLEETAANEQRNSGKTHKSDL